MKVIAIKCPNCGAPLDNINGDAKCGSCVVKCDYCRTVSSIAFGNDGENQWQKKAQTTSETDWAEDLIRGLCDGDYFDQ